jgi:hypothetical protein
LEDFAGLRSNLVDTSNLSVQRLSFIGIECIPLDADNEDQLILSRNIVGPFLLREACKADLLPLCIAVLLDVLLSTFEDDSTLLLLRLYPFISKELKSTQEARVTLCLTIQSRKMVMIS